MPDEPERPEPDASPAVEAQRAYSVRRQLRALAAMKPRQMRSLLVDAYADWSADGGARLGAALAYFTLFSVAPVLIVVTGIVGLFIGQAAAKGQVAPWLERLLSPQGAEAAELMLKQAATPGGGIVSILVGLLTLFLGASALVNELRQSLNLLWRAFPRPAAEAALRAALGA